MSLNGVSGSSYSAYHSDSTDNKEALLLSSKQQKASMQYQMNQLAASDDKDNTAAISVLKQQIKDMDNKISEVKSVSSVPNSNSYESASSTEFATNIGPAYSVELNNNQLNYRRPLGYTADSEITYMVC
jgi:hypothetical protein